MSRILDLCLYFSRPGLNWDKTRNVTDVKLDFISDTGIYQFIERYKRSKLYGTKR